MRAPTPSATRSAGRRGLVWDLLTFERLITGPVIHLIYWCGLGVIVLLGFGVVGAAIGIAIRSANWQGVAIAIPILVGGLLAIGAAGLLWRGACEFYLAVFRIADDLAVLRMSADRRAARANRTPPQV